MLQGVDDPRVGAKVGFIRLVVPRDRFTGADRDGTLRLEERLAFGVSLFGAGRIDDVITGVGAESWHRENLPPEGLESPAPRAC